MNLTESFNGIENEFLGWTDQLRSWRTEPTGQASRNENIKEINARLKEANNNFQEFKAALQLQKEASKKATAALRAFTKEMKLLFEHYVTNNSGNFMLGGEGGGVAINRQRSASELQDMVELSQTLKDTIEMQQSLETLLEEALQNSEQGADLSADALEEVGSLDQERLKREEEERLKREEEERSKREEERSKRDQEERSKRDQEERSKREEEERSKREEEEQSKSEEEERSKREEEEQSKREEEEQSKREEEEQSKREEEERLKREKEERLKREEEERSKREEEEQSKREKEERLKRQEEERQRLEEEERQRREEEERKIREEEQRMAELRRRQSEEEARRKRKEKEKRQRELEDERLLQEEERSWKAVVFMLRDGTVPAILSGREQPGCAIRAPEGAFIRDEIRCVDAPSLLRPDSFPASEEVAGRAVRIEAIGRSELGGSFRGRPVQWLLVLPHLDKKSPGRETVLYVHKNDTWTEVPSEEIQRDGLPSQYSWLETRISGAPITIVPVTRWKVNRFSLTRDGVEIVSQADNRIRLSIAAESISQKNASFGQSFEVRPIQQEIIDELINDQPESYCGLLATSSLVVHTSSVAQPLKRIAEYKLHLPKPVSSKTDSTDPYAENFLASDGGSKGRRSSMAPRKLSRPIDIAKAAPETVIIASVDKEGTAGHWNALAIISDYEKTNTEKILVKISNLSISRKMMALRTTKEFDIDQLDAVCRGIETGMVTQTACLIIRQSADSRMAIVALPTKDKKQQLLEILTSKGYKLVSGLSLESQDEAKELKVMERQMLHIELTGNITSDEGREVAVRFNSKDWNARLLELSPDDPYRQKSFPSYRGFVQVFSELQPDRIAKQAVQLAKLDTDGTAKPTWRSPFAYKAKDAVTQEYLRELASDIQDNWSILADRLGVPKERCSVIRNAFAEENDQALAMLISWLKGTTVMDSKSAALSKALKASGYSQLASELRQRERRMQREANGNVDDN